MDWRGLLQARIKNFPPKAALPTAVVLILALFGFSIWMVVDNASDFLAQSHDYAQRLNVLLEQGSRKLGLTVTPTVDQLIHRMNPAAYAGRIAGALKSVGEGAVFVLIYLGFMIASRQGFAAKTAEMFNDPAETAEAARCVRTHPQGGGELCHGADRRGRDHWSRLRRADVRDGA